MSTTAQIAANQSNAERSTGPRTEQGKAAASQNNLRHGLAQGFSLLPWESQEEFDQLFDDLRAEFQPATAAETLLVEKMAQHHWLSRRALILQDMCFHSELPLCEDDKKLALYLRYQTTHERAFHKCLNHLLRLRAEKRKQEIGFESQKQKQADQLRKQEMHEARLKAVNTKTREREIDNDIRQTIEAPLPGNVRLPFDTLKDVFRLAAYEVNRQITEEKAA